MWSPLTHEMHTPSVRGHNLCIWTETKKKEKTSWRRGKGMIKKNVKITVKMSVKEHRECLKLCENLSYQPRCLEDCVELKKTQ